MDYEAKTLNNQIYSKNHEYEEKAKDASGTAMVSKLKQAIAVIKQELKKNTLDEGIMNSMLFSCAGMKRGQHHLYDEMADPVQVSSATGTKNNTKAAQNKGNIENDEDVVDEDFNY